MTRQAVLKRKQQAVVGRGATVVQSHNRVVVRTLTWVEQCQRTARLRIRCRGTWARRRESVLSSVAISGNVHGRIQSLRTPEVNRARSEITCLCQPVGPNLLFDTEIPLIKIWRMVVHRNADVWRLCLKKGILAECVRERISAGETLPGIRKTARRTVVSPNCEFFLPSLNVAADHVLIVRNSPPKLGGVRAFFSERRGGSSGNHPVCARLRWLRSIFLMAQPPLLT